MSGDSESVPCPKRVHARPASNLTGATALGFAVSVSGLLAGVIRSKVGALTVGASGLGVLAEVQQVVTLANIPAAALTGATLTAILGASRADSSRSPEAVTGAAVGWVFVLSLALGALVVAGAEVLLPRTWGYQTYVWMLLAAVGGIGSQVLAVATTSFAFAGRFRESVGTQIVQSTMLAVTSAALGWGWGVTGLMIAVAVAPATGIAWAAHGLKRDAANHAPKPRLSLGWWYLRNGFLLGATTLTASTVAQVGLYLVRSVLNEAGGTALNGQFQASYAVGTMFLSLLLGGVGMAVFPRIASSSTAAELQSIVDEASSHVLGLAIPALTMLLVMRAPLIELMYSEEFSTASSILGWQLVGDVLRCLAWVYAAPLLLRRRLGAFLVTELSAATVFVGGTVLLSPHLGAEAVGIAYLCSYVVYLAATQLALRQQLGVTSRGSSLLRALGAMSVLTVFVGLGEPGGLPARIVIGLIAAICLARSPTGAAMLSRLRGGPRVS